MVHDGPWCKNKSVFFVSRLNLLSERVHFFHKIGKKITKQRLKELFFFRSVGLKNFTFGLNSCATSNGPFLKGRRKGHQPIRNSFKTNNI